MAPKIWVVNFNGQDFTAAEQQFGVGSLIFLTEGRINTFQTENLFRDLKKRLAEFKAEDSLLVCGSPVINMIALLALTDGGLETVRLQLFHQKEKVYIGRSLRLKR